MYRSKVCVQEFWYFVPGLDIQPEQSKNNNTAKEVTVNPKPQTLEKKWFFENSIPYTLYPKP